MTDQSFAISIPATVQEFQNELKTSAAVILLIASSMEDPEMHMSFQILGAGIKQLLESSGVTEQLAPQMGEIISRRLRVASQRAEQQEAVQNQKPKHDLILPTQRKIVTPE